MKVLWYLFSIYFTHIFYTKYVLLINTYLLKSTFNIKYVMGCVLMRVNVYLSILGMSY